MKRESITPEPTAVVGSSRQLKPPSPSRQIRFHQLLVSARKKLFIDALSDALSTLDPKMVKEQIAEYVPTDAQRVLASAAVRDEFVFPVPAVLNARPALVGYYRLLLGAPQKSFYKGTTGMGLFKSMEEAGTISKSQQERLPDFCRAMAEVLAELVLQIPSFTERDLRELPLLTFGSQLQGSNNTQIGKKAMQDIFIAITEILKRHVTMTEPRMLVLRNASGRTVFVVLSHDPDVSVQEEMGSRIHYRVAIEVKGGTDVSNVHNRAGEAEKSHLKAKQRGFTDFWTIISKTGLEISKLIRESPTTTEWFDITEILGRKGKDWENFRQRLAGAVGIPLNKSH